MAHKAPGPPIEKVPAEHGEQIDSRLTPCPGTHIRQQTSFWSLPSQFTTMNKLRLKNNKNISKATNHKFK